MNGETLLKTMLHSFFVITTGTLAGHYIFCIIFNPDALFTLAEMGNIFLAAIVCDLPYIIFYSKKEVSRKQMLIRNIIHLFVIISILAYLANVWHWVNLRNVKEAIVFFSLVLIIYTIVYVASSFRDKKLADKLNDSLKKRYH